MLVTVMLLLVGLAGYTGAPGWLVLLTAAGMTIEGWWDKARVLLRQPDAPLSSKIITYFVTGIIANIGYATLSYLGGALVRRMVE